MTLAALLAAALPAMPTHAQSDLLQKLEIDGIASFQYAGRSIDADGDTLVVGVFGDDAPAGQDSGSARVFERQDDRWVETAVLQASDTRALTLFGITVAIAGDQIAVGAYNDGPRGFKSGSVYVFERRGGGWQEVAKLIPTTSDSFDEFGLALDIDGDVLAGGSRRVDAAGDLSGGAWVFERIDGVWVERGEILGDDTAAGDEFAAEIAIDNGRVLVGALRATSRPGVRGGAAYVFEADAAGVWRQTAKLTAPDAAMGDEFGVAVDLEGTRAIIGARRAATAVANAGAAYLYELAGGSWVPTERLAAPDAGAFDYFGASVQLNGPNALIGAWLDQDRGDSSGSAYLYSKADDRWTFGEKFLAPDGSRLDYFGVGLAFAPGSIIISAPEHDVAPFGGTGAVYVFDDARVLVCPADLDGDGALTLFDFLEFQNLFATGDAAADFDGDGELTLFDFLAFQSAFATGC